MECPKIESINFLKGKSFFVPGYQRGYRWGEEQIQALLDDLKNYYESGNSSPYYLQPIIVKKKDPSSSDVKYEVIDGQQRLTTIWLLLFHCYRLNGKEEDPFNIDYETRYNWRKEFLAAVNILENQSNHNDTANKKSHTQRPNLDIFKKKNLDYFHIAEVYETIWERVKKSGKSLNSRALQTILEDEDKNKVRIIWSDVTDSNSNNSDAIDSFTNINSGKIKLTCAELIKAVFLQQNIYWDVNPQSNTNVTNTEERLINAVKSLINETQMASDLRDRIAREWDEFERILGNDKFWFFLYDDKYQYDTRIEYIFNLIFDVEEGGNPLMAFNRIYKEMNEISKNPDKVEYIKEKWKEVKKYMATLQNWWTDKKMYHLIGYLISVSPWIQIDIPKKKGRKAKEEKEENSGQKKVSVIVYLLKGLYGDGSSDGWTKSELENEIMNRIVNTFDDFEDDSLIYSSANRENIRRALLFFNIYTILKQHGDERFPFDKFKTENWDVEHVASQTDFNLKKAIESDREEWCMALLQYLTGLDMNEITYTGTDSINSVVFETLRYDNSKSDIIEHIIDKLSSESNKKVLCKMLLQYLKNKDNNQLSDIENKVKEYFQTDDDKITNKDGIGNLTLLNMSINRGYGNAVFPVKRMKVIQGAEQGYYIPICTQKVFQKAYSRLLDQLYSWTQTDYDAYETAIKDAINEFKNTIK